MTNNRSRSNRRSSNVDDMWDGIERRLNQVPPPYMQYYQQPQSQDPKNVAQTTLTLSQLGAIMVVVGSVLLSGFSAWSNLNKDLDIQKNNFDQFKSQIGRDIDSIQTNMNELKRLNENIRIQNQKTAEDLEKRIQDLDASLSQMYQKVIHEK